ncbi:MAG TPA: acyl-CoA dehydrogenase family protein, partial [Bacteroidia bacterium]|nr:acyl-CoA dehydrogenase family protein [Bacteroidia bacterium]
MSTVETATAQGLDFATSETQLMIADTIQKFGKEHIRPYFMEWDESQKFPVE